MSVLSRMVGWMDDQLNPIVVKELRQAVQGRFLSWVLLGFLLIQMILLGGFLLSADASAASWLSSRAGSRYFSFLQAILLGTCMLFVPMYTGVRISLERSDENADLLYISTLSPRAIIAGKFQSAVVLTILIFSACAPFMTVSYLLRGIDLPSIFTSLGISFLAILGGIQTAIFIACLPVGRFFKVILGISLLGALFGWFLMVAQLSNEIVRRGIIATMGFRGFVWVVIALVLAYGSSIAILFTMSVALVSPPSSNRVLPVRIACTVVWFASAAFAIILSVLERSYQPLIAWVILVSFALATILFFTINERESLGYRVKRTIPQNRILRVLAFPFYSGVLSGLAWVLACVFGTLLVIGVTWLFVESGWRHSYSVHREWMVPAGLVMFAFCYAITGYLVRRRWFSRVRGGFTWAFALFVFALCAIVPLLISFFLGMWRDLQEGSMVLTPFVLGSRKYQWIGFSIAAVWFVLMLLAMIPIIRDYLTNHFLPEQVKSDDESNIPTVSA